MEKSIIDSIVDTYEIPQKLKDKIKRIAYQRKKELFIEGYDELYEYVVSLVDKFQIPYEERFFTRLDSPKYSDSTRTNYEFLEIQKEDTPQEKNNCQDKISIGDILDILKSHLDESAFGLIQQLWFKKNNHKLNISQEYLIINASRIQERLEKLVKQHRKRGIFLIPKRPIIQIKTSPLSIKFGRRQYNKNPLLFFKEHQKVYGSLSRKQLYNFDCGLYTNLHKNNQMDLAIPEVITSTQFQKVPLEKRVVIINEYKIIKNAQKTAQKVGVTTATVTKYVRKEGLEIGPVGFVANKISNKKRGLVIETHSKCRNATRVAKKLGISKETVLRIWKESTLPILPRGGQKKK